MDPKRISGKWSPEALVLGPGGVKGFAELGVLLSIENEIVTVKHFAGVSIGALIALLLCCSMNVTEIIGEAVGPVLPTLPAITWTDLPELLKKWQKGEGILSLLRLHSRLTEVMHSKFGFVPTFQQLYMATGKDLIAMTLDVDADLPFQLSRSNTPELSVIDGVMYSMSIPPIIALGLYKGKYLIDGAFSNPYPVNIFPDDMNVLGIFVMSEVPPVHSSIGPFLWRVIHAPIHQIRNILAVETPHRRHILVKLSQIDSFGLTLTTQQKGEMIIKGYQEGEKYLNSI